MSFDPIEAIRAYHAAIDALDFETIGECFAPEVLYISNGVGEIAGRAAVLEAFQRYFSIFRDQVAEDDLVEALSPTVGRSLWRLKATNAQTGEISTRSGEEVVTFNEDGKIVRVDVVDSAEINLNAQ